MGIRAKICGLRDAETLKAAIDGGAAYVGFMFFDKSPRNITFGTAAELALHVPPGIAKVGVVVDIEDARLDALADAVPLDMLQLHGSEPPDRVAEIRNRTGLPVMKAVGVADAEDTAELDIYAKVADQILVDAKAPKSAVLPGGNGLTFDWRLIANRRWPVPWILAGGLTPDNVGRATNLTGATQVDVSSGVESAPGLKDVAKIGAFLNVLGS